MFSEDMCLNFWGDVMHEPCVHLAEGAHVLEIGSFEADWIAPMRSRRPDLRITGIDWRHKGSPKPDSPVQLLQGDILRQSFPMASFDACVSVSTIEHIGLGAYDGDPKEPGGDWMTVDLVRTWIKPGAWFYFDVPYRPKGRYEVHSNYRAYDEDALRARLIRPGFQEVWRKVQTPDHVDAPYVALVLQKV